MKVPLQAWFDKWLAMYRNDKGEIDSSLYYAKPASNQICFVRDGVGQVVWGDIRYHNREHEPPPRDDTNLTGYVIGEHRSKSVTLPVYMFERPDLGLRFVMRGNFYDWKLSVSSEKPLTRYVEFMSTMFYINPPIEPEYTGNELAPCYFEGFPEEHIYGHLSKNPRQWSCSVGDNALITTIQLIMHEIGARKPREQFTKAEHRKQLDEETAARKAERA